jgi:hypothetical protein
MLRSVLAATLLLLAAVVLLPSPAAADPQCVDASLGPDNSAGACVGDGEVLVYRCTFVNCIALRVPIPPVTG